ncbi:Uncharacterised protein [Mycobacteroides abscessus subsp. abscessus]|uniref:DUF7239 family protein n=1 Tax=Mycobacteroides abscessus TaxID=36809 RepID=UPI0009A8628D|nr:hypothetical protein [Mycobacteroides abscessus]QSM04959.1 hypothetical protein PROPHIGD12-2_23 [Mycobacterium phage prophiGD12-2]MBN7355536.1 hypothetical protein [Mycobacteroides abscessus subsp. abscessus]MBN7360315.1 hypothetical protein [Mycobacteroides abscessus subsp. abscessus]MBN7476872.1 hypothetical protein [Mycobacteroides abscessus subsp. abscessus]SLI66814.1 Uncharacterised protein [Mycobacteroides abscessus subsp. abscessus]
MSDIDPREAKLPAWAREQLAKARIGRAAAEDRLNAHLATITKSRIWYGDYTNPIYIDDKDGYQTVYFSPSGSGSAFDQIGVAIRDGAIEIQGGNSVALELQSSNFFRVYLQDWRRSK